MSRSSNLSLSYNIKKNEPLTTFIDQDLLQYDQIWAAAGTPFAVFQLTPQDLQGMTQGQVVNIS